VWVKYNVLSPVQEFVKNPAVNFGFMIVNTSGAQEIDFPSSENASEELRPRLTVSYTDPNAVISSAPAGMRHNGLIIRKQRHGLSLDGSNISSPVEVTVSSFDGKRLFHDRLTVGGQRQLSGLGKGVYIISVKEQSRQQRTAAMLIH